MMFFLTADQKYLMAVLEETRFLRVNQVRRLLAKLDKGKDAEYAKRLLRQLHNMNRVFWKSDDVVSLIHLKDDEIDWEMLVCVDIMLDFQEGQTLIASSKKPPFKLSFLVERKDSKLLAFGIAPVKAGGETALGFQLSSCGNDITVFFLITDVGQSELIQTTLKHFFVIRDSDNKLRYFKGNNAQAPVGS